MSSVKKIIKVGRKVKEVDVEDNKKDTKCCSKCKKDVDKSKYYKSKKESSGLASRCKECMGNKKIKLDADKLKALQNSNIENKNIKYCNKCKIWQDINKFYRDNTLICGYGGICKECTNKKKVNISINNKLKRVEEQKKLFPNEIWKNVPEFPNYEASTFGNIRHIESKIIIKPSKDAEGYNKGGIYKNKKRINIAFHRIIALTFINNPESKPTINHINKIRNDNRIENLEWATYKEQNTHLKTTNPLPIKKKRIFSNNFDDLPNEIWKKINDYPDYMISNMGRLKNINSKRKNKLEIEIKTGFKKQGYLKCCVSKNKINKTFLVHRLVAEMFLVNTYNKDYVNHKDGNRSNNKLGNLEWATASENIFHAHETGLYKKGGRKVIYQLNEKNEIIKEWKSITDAVKCLNINRSNIRYCLSKSITRTIDCKYFWCYKENYNPEIKQIIKTKVHNSKKVNQIDINNNKIIKSWDCIQNAADFLGKSASSISRSLKDGNKFALGFKWEYVN